MRLLLVFLLAAPVLADELLLKEVRAWRGEVTVESRSDPGKAGSGSGTIMVGAQTCQPDCEELHVPYSDYALLTVIPAADSYLKGFEKEDGSPLDPEQFEISPGETVLVIFEKTD